jgi:cadmium resistance protein CadD (predicted permease)
MNYFILTYAVYLLISISLTIWVAKVLFKNGRIFLVDIFHGQTELADSVNKLLVVGFYLINIGYMSLALKEVDKIPGAQEVVEVLSHKLGWIILILGGMHFLNLTIFFKLRNKAKQAELAGTKTPN